MDYSQYVEYSEQSQSGLIWKDQRGGAYGRAGSLAKKGKKSYPVWHIHLTIDGVRYRSTCHRIIWEMYNGVIPDGYVVIHLNSDTTDNRIDNLRCISRATHNLWKAWVLRKANVKQIPSGRWFATIQGYKTIGTFDSREAAEEAYYAELAGMLRAEDLLP